MNFAVIDYIFIAVILFFAVLSAIKGFVKEIFNKLAFILGIIAGFVFYKTLSPYLLEFVKIEVLASVAAFILIFIVVFLVVQIIKVIISKFFENEVLGSLDKALGFFFGILEGFAVVMLFMFLMTVIPFIPSDAIFDDSIFYHLFMPLLTTVQTNTGTAA